MRFDRQNTRGSDKNRFIFVAIDHYSKWIETRVLKSMDKNSITKCIEECIIKKHGVPKRILTDNEKEFDNNMCRELAIKYNFVWDFNSPYHHKSVGAIERANQTLWKKL